MTLLEIERLIRKMSELLQQGGNPDLAPKLAGDYAAACVAANLRLLQCESMIKGGEVHQAIQLAETAPNLLDLITLLESRSANEWRGFCQQNDFQVGERIEADAVMALNECYNQGISIDNPLYATYRKAVLDRNDDEALQTLHSIVRLNPTDTNASTELARLDSKVLSARLGQLSDLLSGGEPQVIVAAIEAIEAFGFNTPLEYETWSEAAKVRCGFLLEQATRLRSISQWVDAWGKLELVRRLETDLDLELPAALLSLKSSLEMWVGEEQERSRLNREFEALLADIQHRVHPSVEKSPSIRNTKLSELRADYDALQKDWSSLTSFARSIPEDASTAFKKRSELIEIEIARRATLRRRLTVLASAVALIVCGVIVFVSLGRMRAREFVRQLNDSVSNRHVRVGERLLEQVRAKEMKLWSLESDTPVIAIAEAFVTKERGLLASFETAYAKLPSEIGSDLDPKRISGIADQFGLARIVFGELATDLKTENEARINDFEKKWQQFLKVAGTTVNQLFEEQINEAEKHSAQLDYRAPMEAARTQISTISGVMQNINETELNFTNHLNFRKDLVQRAAAVRSKFMAYDNEMKKLDEGMAALSKVRTLNDFLKNINIIASSGFSAAPEATAATSVQSIGPSEEGALRSLLGATNGDTWTSIRTEDPARLFPETPTSTELARFQEILLDPAVNATIWHYRIWLDQAGTETEEWFTIGSLDNSQGRKSIKVWIPSATASRATFVDREYGAFAGQWKLYKNQEVFRLELLPDLKETSAIGKVGLNQFRPGDTSYRGPLLPVLDAIKDSRDGSPIFRAYLFCALVQLMEERPNAWGLSFCPSARDHAGQIRTIIGGPIVSGDWLLPSKAGKWNEKLDRFFNAEQSVSYTHQARGNLVLAQSVVKEGLNFVGFVGLDGAPRVYKNPRPAEMWGYAAASKKLDSNSRPLMPLSPLFALPSSPTEYLRKASVTVGTPTFRNSLPPLFRTTTNP